MTAAVGVVRWARRGGPLSLLLRLVSPAERARAATMRRSVDYEESLLGAALLRHTVHEVTGIPAGAVDVHRCCPVCGKAHGRPGLPGTGLSGSVSHAGEWVCVAVSEAGPIGVDIEPVVPVHPGLRHALTTPTETPGACDDRGLLVLWTRKEAVLKATGEGLATPLTSVRVTPPDCVAGLLLHEGRPGLACQLADLLAVPGYAGAVAVLTSKVLEVREQQVPATCLAGRSSAV